MLRTFLACLAICITFCSCKDYIPAKKKTIVYFQIRSTNDSLDKLTREWHQQLFASTKDKSFSRLRPYRIGIGQFLSRNRSAVANLQVAPEFQTLLDNEMVFLANQATLFSDTYSAFEAFNEITPNETINNQLMVASTNLSSMLNTKSAIDRGLQIYAQKNGIKLSK